MSPTEICRWWGQAGRQPWGRRGGCKQQFRWGFSMFLSCSLSTLKGTRVPQNHRWHGRVCPGILQDEEDATCCVAWRFWGRKSGSGDQEKAAALAPGGWGASCFPWHGCSWMGSQGRGCLHSGKGHTDLSSMGGNSLPALPEQGRTNKSKEPHQSGCYLGELSGHSLLGHLCFSSA